MHSIFSGVSTQDLESQYEGKLYGHLKVDTAELVVAELTKLQEEAKKYLDDSTYLDGIISTGATEASDHAERTLMRVYKKLGLR